MGKHPKVLTLIGTELRAKTWLNWVTQMFFLLFFGTKSGYYWNIKNYANKPTFWISMRSFFVIKMLTDHILSTGNRNS